MTSKFKRLFAAMLILVTVLTTSMVTFAADKNEDGI